MRAIRLLAVLIWAYFPLTRVFAQQVPVKNVVNTQTDPAVTAIRKEYSDINLRPIKPEPFKFEAPDCVEDGLITYYRNNNSIVKVTESGSIGDGSWTTDYYYFAGKLIFCYDKTTGGPADGKEVTTEYRLYVKNDRPIRCMENKKIIQPDSKATNFISTAYKLLKAYQTKNFAAALCDSK